MPLYNVETHRMADTIRSANWTVYLHTAAPTDASPTNGRVTAGGGVYASGATLAASDISVAANGDIDNDVAIDFGTAAAAVGTVTHWSSYRGGTAVAYGTLPSTTIANGDSFEIDANSLQVNGAST